MANVQVGIAVGPPDECTEGVAQVELIRGTAERVAQLVLRVAVGVVGIQRQSALGEAIRFLNACHYGVVVRCRSNLSS